LNGKLTTLHSFNGTDGFCSYVCAPMIQANDGNLYGTMNFSVNNGGLGFGTFFMVTPAGTFTTLYNFCAQVGCTDGANPFGIVQGTDRNFYGVTEYGGTNLGCSGGTCGTAFEITANGALTTLYNFEAPNSTAGSNPSGIVQATNGNFYGVTIAGGSANVGTVFGMAVGLRPFVELLPAAGKVGATIEILGTNLSGATAVSFNGVPAAFTVQSATLISAAVPAGATTSFVTVSGSRVTLKSNVRFQVLP
jgi:uncharacterized repeat protein (TIGR03803 family)